MTCLTASSAKLARRAKMRSNLELSAIFCERRERRYCLLATLLLGSDRRAGSVPPGQQASVRRHCICPSQLRRLDLVRQSAYENGCTILQGSMHWDSSTGQRCAGESSLALQVGADLTGPGAVGQSLGLDWRPLNVEFGDDLVLYSMPWK
ncbi:hypothetical protein GGR57DRAFT_202156 [Xylariaceae sp. FL1272]|nr:hypothetical protein GGR57DRAFT_202156 [Xylariaceae sp. FL1272]